VPLAAALAEARSGRLPRPRLSEECWPRRGGFDPVYCCEVLRPDEAYAFGCFGGPYTRASCCRPEVIDWDRPSFVNAPRVPRAPYSPALEGKPRTEPDPSSPLANVTVALLIRSFHRDAEMLRQLFLSMDLYWPKHWKDVVLVLDAESERDRAMCTREGQGAGGAVPSWVRCAFEELPKRWSDFPPVVSLREGKVTFEKGVVRAMWSLYWSDLYSDADYIAEVDSDVVFTGFGVEEVLLVPAGAHRRPKPVWHGKVSWDVRICCPAALLGLPSELEMLVSFPIVMHRRHFAAFRAFIAERMGTPSDFEAGYVRWMVQSKDLCERHGSQEFLPWFQFMVGMYLHAHHHDAYHWAIEAGHLAGLAVSDSCPALQVVTHVHEYAFGKAGYNPTGDVAYGAAASRLIAAGLCGVTRYSSAADAPGSARLLKVCPSREWCAAHGVPNVTDLVITNDRVMFDRYPFRLMTWANEPLPAWRLRQGRLCGVRSIEQMQDDYMELYRNSAACVVRQ